MDCFLVPGRKNGLRTNTSKAKKISSSTGLFMKILTRLMLISQANKFSRLGYNMIYLYRCEKVAGPNQDAEQYKLTIL